MDLEELTKRLDAINVEEPSKIQKVHESYHNSKNAIEQLMEKQMVCGYPVAAEEEDIDKSMYINTYIINLIIVLVFVYSMIFDALTGSLSCMKFLFKLQGLIRNYTKTALTIMLMHEN